MGIVSNLIEFTVFTIGHLFWKQLKFLHNAKHFLDDGFIFKNKNIMIKGNGSKRNMAFEQMEGILYHK